MHGIALTLLTEDKERVSVLQHRLETTNMVRLVFTHVCIPGSVSDHGGGRLRHCPSGISRWCAASGFCSARSCCSSSECSTYLWDRRCFAELASHGFFSARWTDDPVQRRFATASRPAAAPFTGADRGRDGPAV